MVQNQTGGIDPIVDDPIENVCSAKKDSCIPTAINKSDNGLPHLLIYNKVLKSGSTTLQVILRGLAETHNYDLGTDSMWSESPDFLQSMNNTPNSCWFIPRASAKFLPSELTECKF